MKGWTPVKCQKLRLDSRRVDSSHRLFLAEAGRLAGVRRREAGRGRGNGKTGHRRLTLRDRRPLVHGGSVCEVGAGRPSLEALGGMHVVEVLHRPILD